MTSTTPTAHDGRPQGGAASASWACVLGALLALGVTAVHVLDAGGVPGHKDPTYVGALYWALEAAGVVTAALLLARRTRLGWLLSIGVGVGPLVGYVLSRSTGLPHYTDDKGNWTEPLGIVSLVVEGLLLVLSVAMYAASRRAVASPVPAYPDDVEVARVAPAERVGARS